MSPAKPGALTNHVALLRGINLGARNKVPMPALRVVVESLGHEDVQTYIQSGNVVFKSGSGDGAGMAAALESAVTKEFGFRVAVVVRTGRELRRVTTNNPFLAAGADISALHVVFLGSSPTKASVKALDPDRSPPDEFAVRNAEVYLHCPNGFGRSKLTLDYFERKLGGPATVRNWKTVTKLLELMS
ncbi:MAG: DUF1697 domain-containing protein [Acidimicrobiia bacterium]